MRQLKRRSWLPGAVLTWSLTRSKQWRWSPCSHHHEQHCDCSGVIQIPEHLISQDLKWHNQIESIVKKAQQRRYFFHQLRKFNLPQELLIQFYSAIIESVLCTSITVWFSSASNSDHRRLRRVVRTAEQIISTTLPTLQESRVNKRAGKITLDPSYTAHCLFELLPSGWSYRAVSTRMTRHRNSFPPSNEHEHLTIIMVQYLYTYLSNTHT